MKNSTNGIAVMLCIVLAGLSGQVSALTFDDQLNVTQVHATESLDRVQQIIEELESLNHPLDRVYHLHTEMTAADQAQDYARVVEVGEEIAALKEMIVSLQEKISVTGVLLKEAKKIDAVNSSEDQLQQAKKEFAINNYEEAQRLVKESEGSLTRFLKEELQEVVNSAEKLDNATKQRGIDLIMITTFKEISAEKVKAENYTGVAQIKSQMGALNESVTGLLESQQAIEDMRLRSLTTFRVEDLFDEALLLIELGRFEQATQVSSTISSVKQEALTLVDLIERTQNDVERLSAQGLETEKAQSLLEQGKETFAQNDYQQAREQVKQAQQEAERIKTDSLLLGVIDKSQVSSFTASFIKRHWMWILMIAILVLIGIVLGYHEFSLKLLERRIKRLEREKEVVLSLMKKYQIQYFKQKSISEKSYNTAMEKYQERLFAIKKTLPLHYQNKKEKEKQVSPFYFIQKIIKDRSFLK